MVDHPFDPRIPPSREDIGAGPDPDRPYRLIYDLAAEPEAVQRAVDAATRRALEQAAEDDLGEVRARCTLEDPDEPPPRMWTCPARLDRTGRYVVCDYPGVSGSCAAVWHEDELDEWGLR